MFFVQSEWNDGRPTLIIPNFSSYNHSWRLKFGVLSYKFSGEIRFCLSAIGLLKFYFPWNSNHYQKLNEERNIERVFKICLEKTKEGLCVPVSSSEHRTVSHNHTCQFLYKTDHEMFSCSLEMLQFQVLSCSTPGISFLITFTHSNYASGVQHVEFNGVVPNYHSILAASHKKQRILY